MSDETEKKQELEKIQEELNTKGMSRRKFLDRLKGLGLGVGAAAVVGTTAEAHTKGGVSLNSTNPAVDGIVNEGREEAAGEGEGEKPIQTAQYWRYRRWYRRYRRYYYRRYRRWYRRYRRYYYRRYYRRW